MMRLSVFYCAIAGVSMLASAAMAREAVTRTPPNYPAKCAPAADEVRGAHKVIVAYEVTRDGLTENIRVRETTDPCFNEVAVAAVRGWTFERASVSDELETTFTFVYEEPTDAEDFDAAPFLRMPPQYPVRCMNGAQSLEVVSLEFDVSPEGDTENIRIVDSTHKCLNKAAILSVEQWKYRPRIVEGKPVARPDVQTRISFELIEMGARPLPQHRVRRNVWRSIQEVQDDLDAGGDPQAALEELAEIEAAHGDGFTQPELAAFHTVRGRARLETGDYRGALDDFRSAQPYRRNPDSLNPLIDQLERAVAAEEAAAAAGEEALAEPEP